MFEERGPTFFELVRQGLSSTTEGYDLLAPKFDYTPFRTPDEVIRPMVEAVGPARSIDRALDLCCGTGAVMGHLRSRCREEVVGIDLSEGMLEEAARRLKDSAGDARIRLEKEDVFEMSYEQEFDVITCCGAFGHILHDQQPLFAERVWRALRPGGRFMFITAPMPPVLSRAYLFSRGFNAAMHVRNALIKPPFIMFYLTFTLERAEEVLTDQGFSIEVEAPFQEPHFSALRLVTATRAE